MYTQWWVESQAKYGIEQVIEVSYTHVVNTTEINQSMRHL